MPTPESAEDPLHTPTLRSRTSPNGRMTVAFDQLESPTHSSVVTHLDALNHYGVDNTYYGGIDSAMARETLSIESWGRTGLVTRAIHLDICAIRNQPWAAAAEPVTGDELEAALAATGCTVEPGDALLVDMGRDRFEAAGGRYTRIPETGPEGRAGLGRSAAEWLATQDISVVCWDFLDAIGPGQPPASVHLLIYAVGLALVDSCDFALARQALGDADRHDGMLVVAPLRLPGASASPVNPLLVI
jgi:kynurenine formamidase